MPRTFTLADVLTRVELPLAKWFRCRARVLVWTDLAGGYSPSDGFSLSRFVETLRAREIYGRLPHVVTAHSRSGPGADLNDFDFASPGNGLSIDRYDVLFLFAIGSSDTQMEPDGAAYAAIARFMEAGGGVFATGDHEDLGARLGDLPRVRSMRKWRAGVPSASGVDRLTTNLRGADLDYTFADQSDDQPQRVYLNYRTAAGGVGAPHPLMQTCGAPVEHIPDHPHEGECVIPTDLATHFTLDGADREEWPAEAGGARVRPELVALAVSHGGALVSPGPSKQAVEPRAFIAIAAYDGHRARRGRVVTDSTWHHFININIDGTDSAIGGAPTRSGLMPGGVDTPEMALLRHHWGNLAAWLMPRRLRLCLGRVLIAEALRRYPLYEELAATPIAQLDADAADAAGALLQATLATHNPPWVVRAVADDALAEAIGEAKADRLAADDDALRDQMARAAAGGAVLAMVEVVGREKPTEAAFEKQALVGARRGVAAQSKRLTEQAERALARHKALIG